MKRGEIINGYRILRDFTTAGGGQSKWTFALRNDKEYFIKQFLSPVYPTSSAPGSYEIKAEKRKVCERFERHHQRIMQVLKGRCKQGGNLVITTDFFRSGSKYYKVTEKVDVSSFTAEHIADLPIKNQVIILRTVAHSLRILHQANIVHGDLKPGNILIKKTLARHFGAKLIDFDNSYFSGDPPPREELVGDIVYYAPEVGAYLQEDVVMEPERLTLKADIFSIGLVFALFLTGDLPQFDVERFAYPYAAVNNGHVLRLESDELPSELTELIERMLRYDPEERPDIHEVFRKLKRDDLRGSHGLTMLKSPPRTKKRARSRVPSHPRPSRHSGESRTPAWRRSPSRRPEPTRDDGPPASGTLKGSLMRKKKTDREERSKSSDSKLKGSLVDEDET